MTTIAYRDGVLASDTMVSNGGTKLYGKNRKVHKLRDGSLLGMAGSMEEAQVMLDAWNADADVPKLKDLTALLITPDGKVLMYEGRVFRRTRSLYVAIGSGMDYALTALWMGADAVQAVKAGIYFDKNSGGRVLSVHLS